MDLEVKNYIDKLNEELPRLLRWRKEILDQIAIDEKLPLWQTTEKYYQVISSLNKSLDELRKENIELKKKRDDTGEIDVFIKRLTGELEQLFIQKDEVAAMTESEKEKLNKTSVARLEILLDLNKQLINSRLSLEEIKAAKEDFIASLDERQKRIELKDEELISKDKLLTKRDAELSDKEKKILEDSQALAKEKIDIAFGKKSIGIDKQEIERQIVEINSKHATNQRLYLDRLTKLRELNERLTGLNKKEKALLFREEALGKQDEMISIQIDQLDKDKKQLINQQSSLKRAIFLARIRGIKI